MLLLESGQSYLWQWNTNQRIVIDDESVEVVSFSTNGVDAVRREVYQDADSVLSAMQLLKEEFGDKFP